jgi:hypothetical protein
MVSGTGRIFLFDTTTRLALGPPSLISNGYWGGGGSSSSFRSSAFVTNAWSDSSTPSYAFHDNMDNITLVRFQVLTGTSMKMAVFWDVAPCNLVDSEMLTAFIIWTISSVPLPNSNKEGNNKSGTNKKCIHMLYLYTYWTAAV